MGLMAKWQFLLTDLAGNPKGELLLARERKVGLVMSRLPTASFVIDGSNPLASEVLQGDRLVKAYRDSSLRYIGMVIDVEETGEQAKHSLAVTTANPAWRLQKRLMGVDTSAPYPGFKLGTDNNPIDKSELMRQILADVNAKPAGHTVSTGVVMGSTQASSNSAFGKVHMKPVLESISEMLGSIDAPEVEFVPVEPYVSGIDYVLTHINTWYPRMGADKPHAVFEYGTGRHNVESFSRKVTNENLLTRAYSLPESYPDSKKPVKVATDNDAENVRGRYEEVISTDVVDPKLRQDLVDKHVEIRKQARQIITFKPVPNAEVQPFVDYYLGDSIRARAVVSGSTRFDAMFRVYGMTFDIDEQGNEAVELELILPSF